MVDSVQVFGRKKTSVAVAYCKRGRGLIKVNGQPIEFVQPEQLRLKVLEPLLVLGANRFQMVDIRVRVQGGGYTSQIYGQPAAAQHTQSPGWRESWIQQWPGWLTQCVPPSFFLIPVPASVRLCLSVCLSIRHFIQRSDKPSPNRSLLFTRNVSLRTAPHRTSTSTYTHRHTAAAASFLPSPSSAAVLLSSTLSLSSLLLLSVACIAQLDVCDMQRTVFVRRRCRAKGQLSSASSRLNELRWG